MSFVRYGYRIMFAVIALVILPMQVFAQSMEYVVQPGETIASIAARYNVPASAILSLNKLQNPNLLRPGQKILIPGVVPMGNGSTQVYTVQRGDTLYGIARAYQVSAEALMAANRLNNGASIYAGQRLTIPGAVSAPPAAVAQPVNPPPPPPPPPATAVPVQQPVAAKPVAGGLSQRVNGDANFVQTMRAAIQWLAANEPTALNIAEAYISSIAPSSLPGSAMADFRFDGRTKTCNVGMLIADTIPLTASLLYHEALHCKHGFEGVYLPNWQEEEYAYVEQINFLRRHGQPEEQIAFYEQILAQYRNNGAAGH